ncbi:MAG: TerD family protein [Solirubrobacteraceae bacterium]|nr:TerD family protein [Solirubrobacteraceae bacterium]
MSPSINLQQGANASLGELMPVVGTVVVGFGWRLIESNGPVTELVPSAIVCDADGKALSDEHLVFFNQLAAPDGAVRFVDGGDEEQIEVDLAAVPERVDKIVFVVYIDPDLRKPSTYSSVRSAYFRLTDRSGTELVRHDIVIASGSQSTAMIFGEVYRHRGAWKVRAVGQGYSTGLKGVAADFGVEI